MRGGLARVWAWLEDNPVRTLGIAAALAVLLRLPLLTAPLSSDEGGFLFVAEQWHGSHDGGVYGGQWVDRPPFLLLVFKLVGALGGDALIARLLMILLGLVTVGAAWWAGRIINGGAGAAAASLVAATLGASYLVAGYELNGEGIGGAFTLASCALVLQARYRAGRTDVAVGLAFAAGMLAALSGLTKQNLVEAAVFGFVLLVVDVRRTWPLLLAGGAGLAAPLAATVLWAASSGGPGVEPLWDAVVSFREHAAQVMETANSASPQQRMENVALLFLLSGAALLCWRVVVAVIRGRQYGELRLALLVMLGYVAFSIVMGGNWWRHYLLQLVPVLALGTAYATRAVLSRTATWLAVGITVASSAVGAVVSLVDHVTASLPGQHNQAVATWLRDASRPGDSVVLAYGQASVIEMSGLTTPYPYSWSLIVRARDPDLTRLVSALESDRAPTWLVEIGDFDWWGIDTPAFERVRQHRYTEVATVCGHPVYLRDGLSRDLPPPDCP